MAVNDRSDHLGLNTFTEEKLVAANLPTEVPRNRLADSGLEANLAYQIIHDHLMLDGNARLNLATFVGTWMEPEARPRPRPPARPTHQWEGFSANRS